jgi:hypothetical protein
MVDDEDDAVPEAVDFEVGTAPVLVRPYIGEYTFPDTGDEVDPDGAQESAGPPVPLAPRGRYPRVLEAVRRHGRRDGAVPVGRHAHRSGRGPWLVLIAASGVTAAILIVAAIVIAATGGRPTTSGPSGRAQAPVPGATRPASVTPGSPPPGTASSALAGQTAAPTGSPAAAGPQPPADLAQPIGQAPTGSAGPSDPGTPTAQPGPSSPPPVVALTGRITNVAGFCLSAVGVDDRARLWDCDGSAGQAWTLATDGTLRALGQCLQPGAGLVRLANCDASAAQQWRAGTALSLVSFASASCLGDPQAGTSRGTPQRTAPCNQSDPQRWTVPQSG